VDASSFPCELRAVRFLAFVIATAGCLYPSFPAQAADAVVLSIGGNAPESVAEQARAAAEAALVGDGATIVPRGEVVLRIAPSRLRAIASLADARSVAFDLEARMVVGVAVWMSGEGDALAPESVVVSMLVGSRTFSATREMGQADLETSAASAMTDVRGQQTRALMIEGPGSDSAPPPESTPSPEIPARTTPQQPAADHTMGFDIIGPTMLGAFGAAGVGLGVYALMDGVCEQRGPVTGVCLRGEDPNPAVGVTLTVAGTLALAGAVIWFVTGATISADQPRIDVVMGPDGGFLAARGTF
jgi:hypothetical protein